MRFEKGQSGNPAGRPVGSRNKATILAESMFQGEAETIIRMVIDKAKEGDMTAIRLCLERVFPRLRDRATVFDLPPINGAPDALAALTTIVAGVSGVNSRRRRDASCRSWSTITCGRSRRRISSSAFRCSEANPPPALAPPLMRPKGGLRAPAACSFSCSLQGEQAVPSAPDTRLRKRSRNGAVKTSMVRKADCIAKARVPKPDAFLLAGSPAAKRARSLRYV